MINGTLATATGAVALVVGIAAGWALAVRVPRAWRERRWARRFGDQDERRIGDELWWGHVSKLAGVTATSLAVARWAVVDTSALPYPEVILAAVVAAIVFSVTVLVAQLR